MIEVDDRQEQSETESGAKYLMKDRGDGKFRRVFRLTKKSNSSVVSHSVSNGVLKVVVQKVLLTSKPKATRSKSEG